MPPAQDTIYLRPQQTYRRRLANAGEAEYPFRLHYKTIALIDEVKQRHGLRNRGQVLEHENSARELLMLLEQRREIAHQQ
jgi:hypothetical protein